MDARVRTRAARRGGENATRIGVSIRVLREL
jgi:hypothetical protein